MGGAERQALCLARHLRDDGHDVQLWGLCRPGLIADRCDEMGLPWRIVPFRWPCRRSTLLKTLPRFAWRLRKARPDVVLAFTGWANVACGLSSRFAGARLCVWNQRDVDPDTLVGRHIVPRAVRRTDAFVANSQAAATFLADRAGIDINRIRVIPNAVLLDKSQEPRVTRDDLAIPADALVACMVANIRHPKDHVTLVRAWSQCVDRLAGEGGHPVLLLAGRPMATHDAVKALVSELHLESAVRFLGEVQDVRGLLQCVDLGVLTSHGESCSNAILEYMDAGLAVVGTDIAGIREVVGEANHCHLAPPEDSSALSDRLVLLLADSDRRREVGEQNRSRVETTYSERAVMDAYRELIDGDVTQ